ncbi:MAG: carboxymuconolactone decarboxylase family protein [Burkholderiales bacterium]|nr:carboxymuconolactone decarboxylase family protein [Burkholderiales bacterium]
MARIEKANLDQLSTTTRTQLDAVRAKVGKVPNMFATMANSSAVLTGYLQFGDALSKGELTAQDRETIALAVGQANSCGYCLSAHTLLGKGAGLTSDDIQAARAGKGSAVAELAQRIVATRGQLSDGELAAARAAGLSDAQILEVVAGVALNVLTNYTNNLVRTDIDFPEVAV